MKSIIGTFIILGSFILYWFFFPSFSFDNDRPRISEKKLIQSYDVENNAKNIPSMMPKNNQEIIEKLNSLSIGQEDRKKIGEEIEKINELRLKEIEYELTDISEKLTQLEEKNNYALNQSKSKLP